MSILLHGDCLEELKSVDDKSIDLIFCDLPYGQTSCKWDCKIDLDKLWIEIMRIKKLNTPIFFTTTTKFGVSLITSAPKKCYFRYDIVWVKSAPAGFLSAKKMPLRKHELIYVFYEKLPFYDLSSHKHKFLKEPDPKIIKDTKHGTNTYGTEKRKKPILRLSDKAQYEPPLPTSVVKDGAVNEEYEGIYGGLETPDYIKNNIERNKLRRKYKKEGKSESSYEPPLPTSVIKEEEKMMNEGIIYNNGDPLIIRPNYDKKYDGKQAYDPPLPTSVIKEDNEYNKERTIATYGKNKEIRQKGERGQTYEPPLPTSVVKEDVYKSKERFKNGKLKKNPRHLQKGDDPIYDPPLPTSVIKEEKTQISKKKEKDLYGACNGGTLGNVHGTNYNPPLPTSIIKEEPKNIYSVEKEYLTDDRPSNVRTPAYEPPLPTSMLEIKSTRGKHSTEKPVALMEWILKYYSKEGDTVLDPTMGSGSTGVACVNMNRNFIGIEKDPEYYEVAVNRIEK
jgi:DNA modification methylase